MATVSGTTKDTTGALASKLVRVYRADTGVLVGSVMSAATTGAWSVTTADTSKHFAVMHDASGDIYWPQTKVLLSMNADMLDARGHTFTSYGGGTISTARSAYSGGGSYLGNGTNSYLSATSSTDFNLGAGDFCIELHAYITGDGAILAKRTDYLSSESYYLGAVYSSQTLVFNFSSTGSDNFGVTSDSWVLPVNTWTHIAIERYSGIITMYINGVVRASTSTSATCFASSEPLIIGASKNGSTPATWLPGNINGLRFTVGAARYKAAFTPPTLPTSPLPTYTQGSLNGLIYDQLTPV